jgi:anion-transporting  ArsA/GET3 family ATPase
MDAGVMTGLLKSSKLIMVTGKGGTGKTTFACALALLGARLGRRTVLCEIDNQRPSCGAVFGRVPRFEPVDVLPNLSLSNIEFTGSLEGFIEQMVPMPRVVRLVLENKMVHRFLDFTPGSRELVIMSRLGALCDQNDLVVVDMPASGHAFSLLDILRSARGLFRSGPVRAHAEHLTERLRAATSRLVFVALPEEMVVNETLETMDRMAAAALIGGPPVVLLNRATLPSLTTDERSLLARLAEQPLDPVAREFVRAGRWEDRLEQATKTSVDRLRERFGHEPPLIPPAGGGGVPREIVTTVAVHLGRQVGLTRREVQWT